MRAYFAYLNSLPSSRDGIYVAEVMKDALSGDLDALAFEGSVGVTCRLRCSFTDLRCAEDEQATKL